MTLQMILVGIIIVLVIIGLMYFYFDLKKKYVLGVFSTILMATGKMLTDKASEIEKITEHTKKQKEEKVNEK